MDSTRIQVEVLALDGQKEKDDMPFEQKLIRNKAAVEKARIELQKTRPKLNSLEQAELGFRREVKAREQMKATFGGLVLGYDGVTPPDSPPGDPRGLIFQPGTNLGPEYPDDFKMTPFCQEKADTRTRLRVRDIWGDRPVIKAHFSPVLPADFGGKKTKPPSCMNPDNANEFRGESPHEKSLLVFFGKSEELKRFDCPPYFVTSDEIVMQYYDAHNIEGLLEYLLAMVSLHFPDDPYEYMGRYCGHLADARTDQEKFDDLQKVFYPRHLKALFRLHDKARRSYLTLTQFKYAMEMLGFIRYNNDPEGGEMNAITEATFIKEANRAHELQIRSFLV